MTKTIYLSKSHLNFSDEFYITIVSNIVPDNTCNIGVGESEEEKAENLEALIQFLSSIVEMDLSHINGRAIVEQRDDESAKHLLELIFELIVILKQEQEEQGEDGEAVIDEHLDENLENQRLELEESKNSMENLSELKIHQNINIHNGSNNFNQKSYLNEKIEDESNKNYSEMREESYNNMNIRDNKSVPTVDFEVEDNTSSSGINFRQNYSQNDLTRYEKVMAYLASNEELLAENQMEQDSQMKMNFYSNSQLEESDSRPAVNISRISEVSRSKENSEPNQKYIKNNITKDSKLKNESNSVTVKNTNSNKFQGDSYGPSIESKRNRHAQNQNDGEDYPFGQNTESVEIDVDGSSKSLKINNKLKDLKNSHNDKNSKVTQKKINKKDSDKSSTDKSGSQNNKNKSLSRSNRSNISSGRNKAQYNFKSKDISNLEAEKLKFDKYESSQFEEISQNEGKLLRKTKSHKKLISKEQNEKNKSEISMTSINVSNNSKINQNNTNIIEEVDVTENMIEELPLSEENLKFEVMKEFRRIYGDKLDKVVLKNNLKNSGNIIEVILRNIKLARQKMVKLGVNNTEADDLIVNLFFYFRLKSSCRSIVKN